MIIFRLLVLAVLAISMTACSTYNAPRYGVSTQNVLLLKQQARESGVKIKVNEFTANKEVKQEIMCRAAGPVRANPGQTFEKYIRDALVDEMLLAEVYTLDAPIAIDGKLDYIEFDSDMNESKWLVKLTLSSNAFETFTIDHQYHFSGVYVAESACNNMADALIPTVQDLNKKIFNQEITC